MASHTVNHARVERDALSDLLTEVGPTAPTLCEGWTTLDLAAHLVVRERRPDSAPGIMIKALSGWTEKVRLGAAGLPYAELVGQVRTGPPRFSLFGLPGVDAAANTVEYFIHHEDVRRAQPGGAKPRQLDPELADGLWKRAQSMGKMFLRKSPVGVALRRTDSSYDELPVQVHKGDPAVTVSGDAGELLLFLYGRKDAAQVDFAGDAASVAALKQTPLGI